MAYKSCVVPQCKSTSIRTPEKLFVSVPTDPKRRKMWLQLSSRDPNSLASYTNIFMCEDHFDMEKDTTNYLKYKMGFSKYILLTKEAIPTKFPHQSDCIVKEKGQTSRRRKKLLTESSEETTDFTPQTENYEMQQVLDDSTVMINLPDDSSASTQGVYHLKDPVVELTCTEELPSNSDMDDADELVKQKVEEETDEVIKPEVGEEADKVIKKEVGEEADEVIKQEVDLKIEELSEEPVISILDILKIDIEEHSVQEQQVSSFRDTGQIEPEDNLLQELPGCPRDVPDTIEDCGVNEQVPSRVERPLSKNEEKMLNKKLYTIIVNVYRFLDQEYRHLKAQCCHNCDFSLLTNITKRTATAVGVTDKTVAEALKAERTNIISLDHSYHSVSETRRSRTRGGRRGRGLRVRGGRGGRGGRGERGGPGGPPPVEEVVRGGGTTSAPPSPQSLGLQAAVAVDSIDDQNNQSNNKMVKNPKGRMARKINILRKQFWKPAKRKGTQPVADTGGDCALPKRKKRTKDIFDDTDNTPSHHEVTPPVEATPPKITPPIEDKKTEFKTEPIDDNWQNVSEEDPLNTIQNNESNSKMIKNPKGRMARKINILRKPAKRTGTQYNTPSHHEVTPPVEATSPKITPPIEDKMTEFKTELIDDNWQNVSEEDPLNTMSTIVVHYEGPDGSHTELHTDSEETQEAFEFDPLDTQSSSVLDKPFASLGVDIKFEPHNDGTGPYTEYSFSDPTPLNVKSEPPED